LEDGARMRLGADLVVNAAGIWSTSLAWRTEGLDADRIPKVHLAKGAFFSLAGASPFNRLIVPAPEWHLYGGIYTLDLAHQGRFGPDVEWVEGVDYTIDPTRAGHVYDAVRRYYPALADEALAPAYTGVRSRLNGPGEAMADWIIQGPAEHGLDGLVNLYGVESPGITASPAIAEAVEEMLTGVAFEAVLVGIAKQTKGRTAT
jgi:L-2-hydroxyglutarate oxidase LhgO